MNGKAAIFLGAGQGYELREMEVPPPEPDGILVRVSMAGICGSDLHIWRGDSPAFGMLNNTVVGHEMTGRVAALGASIKTDSLGRPLKEGDRIAYAYFYPCNRCYQCNRGEFAACPAKVLRMSGGISPFQGAYAEYYYLKPGHWVFKVPDELPDEVVTPVNCALSQVTYGLHQAGVRFGDTVVIQGAGGLGLNACAVAKDMGADRVIIIDALEGRLELARQFGADETISIRDFPEPLARVQRVLELTEQRGGDVVCEFVGLPDVVTEGVLMTRQGGTYLEIGNISFGRSAAFDPSNLVWGSKKIVGVVMYNPWVIPEALDFLVRTRDKYPFDQVVSHQYPLAEINRAFQEAEWSGEGPATAVRRAVIVP